MSVNTFPSALKSTIDYKAKLLANSQGLSFIDLASPEFDTAVLEASGPAIVYEFSTLSEDPFDPLWFAAFDVGVMTAEDPAQYISLELIGVFLNAFKTGTLIPVLDYTDASMPTQQVGTLYVVSSGVTSNQSDQVTGLRFVTVTARAVRSG